MPSSLIESINYYQEFKDLYFEILNDFGYDREKDREARDVLIEIIQQKVENASYNLERVLLSFKETIRSRQNIFIYGCGPSLEDTVEHVLEKFGIEIFQNSINLAADGASLFLREKNIIRNMSKLVLPKSARRKIFQNLEKYNYKFKPRMSEETHARLRKIFLEDIKTLEKIIDRDLHIWYQ